MKKARVYIDTDGVMVDFESAKRHFNQEDLEKANGEWDNVEGIFSKMQPKEGRH